MKRLMDWLSFRWLLNDLNFCGCCYARPLVSERSWGLDFWPRPLPVFSVSESEAAWRIMLGWFELRITRPGMGFCFRRRV